MKIKDGFIKREVAGTFVVVSVNGDFNGMITLNETSNFLWETLEKVEDREGLVNALLEEYDVTKERAEEGVDKFLSDLKKVGCIEK